MAKVLIAEDEKKTKKFIKKNLKWIILFICLT